MGLLHPTPHQHTTDAAYASCRQLESLDRHKCCLLQILQSVHLIQDINMIIVFFISGLVLKTQDLKTALHHKLGVAFGFVSILLLTPCLGFAIRYLPLNPSAFAAGLTLLSAVPTTLGIGIALVRSCKGNEGLALLLTVGSNLLGVVTIPLWLKALFASSAFNLNVDILNLFMRLVVTIFVPSVLGKVSWQRGMLAWGVPSSNILRPKVESTA